MTEDQLVLLRDKHTLWVRASHQGGELDDYNRRMAEALGELLAEHSAIDTDPYDYRSLLHDLVSLDGEEWAIGGGPGFKDRYEKAWRAAREPFEP